MSVNELQALTQKFVDAFDQRDLQPVMEMLSDLGLPQTERAVEDCQRPLLCYALGAMQEILIKVLTRLASFEGRSSFRTWRYRIVVNHVLNMKRGRVEHAS